MAAFYQTYSTPAARTGECAPAACPECGGLECLCRPRFFAGQLLTDEDLNLLDHYIVEKGKLHNRHLQGWGVVCGLEVVCNPCNAVTVRAGYALGPCGEDIVVCADQIVDICALVKKCRDTERRRRECEPFGAGAQGDDCKDVSEDWVLSVRYEEKPSRGVMSLKGGGASSSCGCGSQSCGCGGQTGGCGCRAGQGGSKKSAGSCGCKTTTTATKTAPPQCEPTVTCEGFVFEVCRVTPAMKKEQASATPGALAQSFLDCIKELVAALPQEPSASEGKSAWQAWCCNLKEALLDYLASHPVYDCLLAERLARFICPDPGQFNSVADYQQAVKDAIKLELSLVAAEYIRYCACSALLPPCPLPVEDPRVPLATVTVRRDNCRVVRVCNLSYRKFATTLPNLQYWLSFIPFLRQLRRAVEKLCCGEFQRDATGKQLNNADVKYAGAAEYKVEDAQKVESAQAQYATPLGQSDFAQVLQGAWQRREETVDARTIFLAAAGATDEQGQPYMSDAEERNPFAFLLLNQVAHPLFTSIPDETPDLLKCIVEAGRLVCGKRQVTEDAAPAAETSGGGAEDLSALRAQLEELRQTVESQQSKIDELDGKLREKQ
ncbi:MAG TPA: hypothetical protein VHU19_11160 [Pyrinomonadaceae bacterium]|jgi:hypothetical protein|nr:hypothetical protein [Pyrinomonadaceae bacterium]